MKRCWPRWRLTAASGRHPLPGAAVLLAQRQSPPKPCLGRASGGPWSSRPRAVFPAGGIDVLKAEFAGHPRGNRAGANGSCLQRLTEASAVPWCCQRRHQLPRVPPADGDRLSLQGQRRRRRPRVWQEAAGAAQPGPHDEFLAKTAVNAWWSWRLSPNTARPDGVSPQPGRRGGRTGMRSINGPTDAHFIA